MKVKDEKEMVEYELNSLYSDLEFLTNTQYSLEIYMQAPAREVWKGYWSTPDPIGLDLGPPITEKIRAMCIKYIESQIARLQNLHGAGGEVKRGENV